MPDITTELNNIMNARYGKDVRKSIHDGIKKVNDNLEDVGVDELLDARIGWNGVVHENTGDAIRENGRLLSLANSASGVNVSVGYIDANGGLATSDQNRFITSFIPCYPGCIIHFKGAEINHDNVSSVTFYDKRRNRVQINPHLGEDIDSEYTIQAPKDAWFVRFSYHIHRGSGFTYTIEKSPTSESLYLAYLSEYSFSQTLLGSMNQLEVNKGDIVDGKMISNKILEGSNWMTKLIDNENSFYLKNAIDVSQYMGDLICIKLLVQPYLSTRGFGFCDASNNVILSTYDKAQRYYFDGIYYYTFVRVVGPYFFFSSNINNKPVNLSIYKLTDSILGDFLKNVSEKPVFVSTTGSDTSGDGSVSLPFATVSKALEIGGNILIKNGIYDQQIDLSKTSKKNISISSYDLTGRVIFRDPNCVISNTEQKISGYSKVYKALTSKTFSDNNIWIFQDNVSDINTLISNEERHPLERGKKYRCDDTMLERCSSTKLNDALSEIDGSNQYKWYYDSEAKEIYFSRPSIVSAKNPICGSFGNTLFLGSNRRELSLKLSGIETKYLAFNVNSTTDSVISDCKASNIFGGGAFTYNSCLNVNFLRCEAARCYNASNGDGFNGHSYNTGDPYSKQTTCTMVDCWSHDNNDDGYSDHERSETTIFGGLYEYNGKAGITPSYGSHCTCYNVYSRKNYSGFYYTGSATAEEGGEHGQMTCFNCVAEENTRGGVYSGFAVDGDGNHVLLVGCKSIKNVNGYKPILASNTMTMIDCGSLGDTNVKAGDGSFVIENTNIVSQ